MHVFYKLLTVCVQKTSVAQCQPCVIPNSVGLYGASNPFNTEFTVIIIIMSSVPSFQLICRPSPKQASVPPDEMAPSSTASFHQPHHFINRNSHQPCSLTTQSLQYALYIFSCRLCNRFDNTSSVSGENLVTAFDIFVRRQTKCFILN